jgi:hypothetical protein
MLDRLSPEVREVLQDLIRQAVLRELEFMRLRETVKGSVKSFDQQVATACKVNHCPETLILTEQDFRFLEGCGIGSKGMLLGENSRG